MKNTLLYSYFKLLTVALLFVGQFAVGQTVIARQDFEISPANPQMNFTTSNINTPKVGTGYSTGDSGSNSSPSAVNLFSEGVRGYRIIGDNGTAGRILTFSDVNTTGYTGISLTFRVAGMSIGSTSNGMDTTNDEVLVEISPDGGLTWYQQAKVNSEGSNLRWYFGATGKGTRAYLANNSLSTFSTTANVLTGSSSSAISTVEITDLPSVSNLKVRISAQSNADVESWILDDVRINGLAQTSAPVIMDQTVNSTVGTAINYQILATNSPTSYSLVTGTLPAGLNLDTTTGLISGTPSAVTSSSISVTATNGIGTSAPATILFNIAKANQTITFAVLADKQYGDAPFNLNATTTSGLPISYTSNNANVATISGNTVTIIGIGSAEITASQAGNDDYNSAQLIRTFTVTRRNLTVTGLTANNKVEDGTTDASLNGTGVLNNVLPADAGQVILSGTPTATFAQASPGTNIPVSLASYTLSGSKAANYQITQPTGLTANITVLGTPVAITADEIGSNSFIAKWNAVVGATNYRLDVYTGTSAVAGTTITETFENIGTPPLAGYATRTWTGEAGITWTALKARTDQEINGKAITLENATGSSLKSGEILNGLSNITFSAQQKFTGSGGVLTIKVLSGPAFGTITTIGTHPVTTTVSTYNSGAISGITGPYQILIEKNASARVAIDDLSFTSAPTSAIVYVSGYENLSVGNVTSHLVSGLNPETHYFYRVRAINGTATSPNSNTIEVTTTIVGTTCIWDGLVWSNNDGPDASIDADIQGVYDTDINGVFTARNLTITSGSLTVRSGATITVIGALKNTLTAAAVVLENNANLIQGGTTNVNIGDITVKRNSSALKRQDYTMWSSPTTGAQTLLNFSPATLPNRFYTYNSATDLYNSVDANTTAFATAKSYLIRMPNTHPTEATIWEGSFVGKPNSGNISFPLAVNSDPAPENTGNSYNAVGNPYPSPIDAFAFVQNATNASSITGTLYFWRKTNNAASPSYSTWTTAGFVSNGEEKNVNPNGVIQTGQGFIVENAGTGTVEFTNAMRVDNHADQFFKTSNTVEYNRIWLNATNADGLFSQTLVGYITDSSDDLDRADGKYMNDGPIALTSIINDTPYAIQARSLPFQATDLVPLQFKATTAGTYTIAIDHVDGLFDGSQAVFLKDIQTGLLTNLSKGNYTFNAPAGVSSGRFEIVYENDIALGTGETVQDELLMYRDGDNFIVRSNSAKLSDVKLYDASGRLVYENNPNAKEVVIDATTLPSGMYILKLNEGGKIVTKKLIK